MSEYFRKYIKKEHYPVHPTQIRFKTLFKNCVLEALRRRGWKETEHEQEWDIYWAEKEWIHEIMDHTHLNNTQRVNHFRNHYELTRKDLMIKNLKRYKKQLEKDGKLDEAAAYNFFPITYNLPSEYSLFCEEFKKNNCVWIMKPIGKAQGKGIFLFNKLNQISQWKSDNRWKSDGSQVENYIVQKYINNPLLIGGKKFDMRIYCLVTSYTPLVAYLYRNGFARFTHHRYDNEDITNTYVHLTNVAIQKTSENYDEKLGGKWDLRTLKLYMMSRYGQEKVSECFASVQTTIIRALQSVQKIIINDKHCFELYGFDILFDATLKPWILEVNASPSMTANTPQDFELKCNLLDDAFTIIDMERVLTGQEEQVGGFDLICKGTPIKNESTLFSTMLGCFNNRSYQLKKLAKIISSKLAQNFNQEKEDAKKKVVGGGRDSLSSASTSETATNKAKIKTNSKTAINNPAPVQTSITNTTTPNPNLNQAAKINKPIMVKQQTNSFTKENKDTKIIKPNTKPMSNIPTANQNPMLKPKQSTLPPVSNTTSGSLQSNLLQKTSTPGISTTVNTSGQYVQANSPGISKPGKDGVGNLKTSISNSPGMSNGMRSRGISNTQAIIDQNADLYNYDIDKPFSQKGDKNDRNLDESATINYDNKHINASNNSSEEGKSKSYGNLSNNEDE